MILYALFAFQALVTVGSLAHIYYTADRVNYQYLRAQTYVWALVFLLFGPIPWLANMIGATQSSVIVSSLVISIVGAICSTWDREIRVDKVEEEEFEIKKYRFVLGIGAYKQDSISDYLQFILNPQKYVVEIHMREEDKRKEKKFCFEVNNGTPSDKIKTDPRVLHGCRLCEKAEKDFVQLKYCWNNPSEHRVNDSDICQTCYIQLTDKVEQEISRFESPKGEFLAANL